MIEGVLLPGQSLEVSPVRGSSRSAKIARPDEDVPVRPLDRADIETPAKGVGENEIDRMLVERVRKGERAAFDVLVRKYQHRILHAIMRYVGDPHEAEDVAQETFLRAYRAIDGFRGESSFYTWLFRIAVNAAKNWLVAQGRRPPGEDLAAEDAVNVDSAHRLRDHATPEGELMRQEIERLVYDTVRSLPEEIRRALTLREVEGLSYEEIAKTMNCPIGTVRSRIFRAREAIEQRLRSVMNDGEQ